MNGVSRDWAGIRQRLEAAEAALQMRAEPTREEIDRIYRKRAEELARPLARAEDVLTKSILVFRAGNVRFGIRVEHVAEVVPHRKIARVPGAPSEIAGLVQVRGEVRPVWNLPALLGLNLQEALPTEAAQILLLRDGEREIGVIADAIEDIAEYDPGKLQPSPAHLPGAQITAEYVTLLDLGILFAGLQGSTT